jgi:hypothetical protein
MHVIENLFLLVSRVANLHRAVVGEVAVVVLVHVGSSMEPSGQAV